MGFYLNKSYIIDRIFRYSFLVGEEQKTEIQSIMDHPYLFHLIFAAVLIQYSFSADNITSSANTTATIEATTPKLIEPDPVDTTPSVNSTTATNNTNENSNNNSNATIETVTEPKTTTALPTEVPVTEATAPEATAPEKSAPDKNTDFTFIYVMIHAHLTHAIHVIRRTAPTKEINTNAIVKKDGIQLVIASLRYASKIVDREFVSDLTGVVPVVISTLLNQTAQIFEFKVYWDP